MNKKTNPLARAAMLLLVVLCSIGAWAQSSVVTVGNYNRASGFLPSYPNNTYSLSQQIYTKDEIGGKKGKITSIAFYNYEHGKARSYDIYLSHTSKSTFDNATDWVKVAAADKVFSGTVTLGSEWTTITSIRRSNMMVRGISSLP